MYTKTTDKIKVFVDNPANTKSGQSYYSGEGELVAIDKEKVCVKFQGKGSVWFDENQIRYINEREA